MCLTGRSLKPASMIPCSSGARLAAVICAALFSRYESAPC